jgi:hypothetical protein
LQTWVSPYSNFVGNVTVPTSDAIGHSLAAAAAAVSGAPGGFDAGGPVHGTGGGQTITTVSGPDFIFGNGFGAGAGGAMTGWTRINTASVSLTSHQVFYRISAAGSYTFEMDSGNNIDNGATVDALTPTGTGGGPTSNPRLLGLLGD